MIRDAIAYYVEPDCSSVDPCGEDDLRPTVGTHEQLFRAIDRFIDGRQQDRHLLLLADSGMGKTAFLLNYYNRNRLRTRGAHRIAVVPLGRADAIRQIQGIVSPRDTILFLDAFDEDAGAVGDYKGRLQEIMTTSADFRRVVMTCRTQSFRSDEEIPKEPGVAIVGPRAAGQSDHHRFRKIYLVPFDEHHVVEYLNRRFPMWRYRSRTAALRMAKRA